LAFVIFITVAFRAEIDGLIFIKFQEFGSKIRLEAWHPNAIIDRINVLEHYVKNEPLIVGAAYKSYQLGDVSQLNTSMSNLGKFNEVFQNIYAVSPNYFEIVDNTFFYPSKVNPSGYSIGRQLYAPTGYSRIIL
jgi:hypothetical protein